MRLISIDISNFRVIKSARFEFPDNVIGIIGPNGAGKSSIVEAIAWALYGNPAARSGKDEIRATFAGTADDCRVELGFQINGQAYRIVRKLIGKNSRAEVELYRGNSSESVGSAETQRHVGQILGLDWRGFLTSFLARQQELNALSDLQPAKRREHLVGMLGIERLDKALQRVKDDTRLSSERAAFIRTQLQQKEQVLVRLGELREHVKKAQVEHEDSLGAHAATKKAHSELAEKYQSLQAAKDACSRIAALLEAQDKTAALLADQSSGLAREHDSLRQSEVELEKLNGALVDFDRLKGEVDQGREIKSRVEYVRQLSTQRSQFQSELERVGQKLIEAERKRAELDTRLGPIPADIESRHRQAKLYLDKTRDRFSQTRASRDLQSKEIARATGQIEDVRKIGPEAVCDRCHRPFGSDLPKVRQHLQSELQGLQAEEVRLNHLLQTIKSEGETASAKEKQLADQASLRLELTVKLRAVDGELTESNRRKQTLAEQLKQVVAQTTETGELEFDQTRFGQACVELEAMEAKRTRQSRLAGSLGRLPEVLEGISQVNQQLTAVSVERDRLQAELKQIGFDQVQFDCLASEFASLQTRLDKEQKALVELSTRLEVMQKELQVKEEQLAGFDKAEEELERSVSDQYYGEKLSGLFADFRKHIIARIRPRLAELSTSLFSEMTGDKFNLVELDEDYNLQIMDYGHLFGIERFSGGEKDLANLCLRLAISLALTESAGLDRSFVILDEVFGSQDDERRRLIFNGLASLKNRFPQVMLITHIGEIKNQVETLIEVEPTSGGWSEVRVNDKPAQQDTRA